MIYNVYVYDSHDEIKSRDFVASFTNRDEAEKFIIENQTDIWETCFDIAILEVLQEGPHYGEVSEYMTFKYNQTDYQYHQMENYQEVYKEIMKNINDNNKQNILIHLALKNGIKLLSEDPIVRGEDEYTGQRVKVVLDICNNEYYLNFCETCPWIGYVDFKDFGKTWKIYYE